MKYFFIFLTIIFSTTIIFAQEADNKKTGDDIELTSELFFQASSLPEAKLGFNQYFKFPMLQGDGSNFLISGNHLKLVVSAEVTPISLDAIIKAVLQPIAFLEFTAGARAGSGWQADLFGSYIQGIGFNVPDENGNVKYDGSAFDSANWRVFGGGMFQFDFAAIFPGDWNHVVMQTYHEISYRANTRAVNNESWYYENDDGEKRNGMMYFGNITLGYQMPKVREKAFLYMAALQAEMESYLYEEDGGDVWGDNLMRWRLAPVLQFMFADNIEVFFLVQFRTLRNFTNFNYGKDEKLHYKSRILDTSDPIRMEFYRVAAAVIYRF